MTNAFRGTHACTATAPAHPLKQAHTVKRAPLRPKTVCKDDKKAGITTTGLKTKTAAQNPLRIRACQLTSTPEPPPCWGATVPFPLANTPPRLLIRTRCGRLLNPASRIAVLIISDECRDLWLHRPF